MFWLCLNSVTVCNEALPSVSLAFSSGGVIAVVYAGSITPLIWRTGAATCQPQDRAHEFAARTLPCENRRYDVKEATCPLWDWPRESDLYGLECHLFSVCKPWKVC